MVKTHLRQPRSWCMNRILFESITVQKAWGRCQSASAGFSSFSKGPLLVFLYFSSDIDIGFFGAMAKKGVKVPTNLQFGSNRQWVYYSIELVIEFKDKLIKCYCHTGVPSEAFTMHGSYRWIIMLEKWRHSKKLKKSNMGSVLDLCTNQHSQSYSYRSWLC